MKTRILHRLKSGSALALLTLIGVASASAGANSWKFGVIDDTQWTCATDPAGLNPNHVSASIISQINPQFINAGVKFVVQVGDLTDQGQDADIAERATAAQPLMDAGIGFFPLRGNHETYGSANSFGIPAFQASFPQTQGLTNTFGAVNFCSPTNVSMDLNGMSYSFDFGTPGNSARFVILDNWATPSQTTNHPDGYAYGYSFGDQKDWISGQLDKNARGTEHAFVFSHQPLIAENHQDSPFVGWTDANPDMQNAFFASLATNNVKYYIAGHDHVHQRSIITSPDGNSKVEEIIGASDSSKFYTPKATNDAGWNGQKVRELSLSQERYTVGYYIYTVDGPRVTVEYYSDNHGNWSSDNNYPLGATANGFTNQVSPAFHFVKKETFGYSLNGQSFTVSQGQAYTNVQDSIVAGSGFIGTSAKILGGANASATKDYSARPLTKEVTTGWSTNLTGLASDVLSVWGLQEVGAAAADVCAFSLSYNTNLVTAAQAVSGGFCLVSKDTNGNWVSAVSLNNGGAAQFVLGAYNSSYPLGAYGVDTNANTVWAVVNYQGDFAASVAQLEQAAVLGGPISGAVVTNSIPSLNWLPVAGASSYTVKLINPSGVASCYTATSANLPLSFPMTNGYYSWTVTASNSGSVAPVSVTGSFTLQRSISTAKWSFGVLSDTQWTTTDDGKNPNTIAANIVKQVDSQFIAAGVKLVVAVGDMADDSSDATTHANNYVRALYAQDLYNAGIGFYPTRGNHEAANGNYTGSSADFRHIYPQIVPGATAGLNNSTPADDTISLVNPAGDLANNAPAAKTGSAFSLGMNFSAPTAANLANDSVSYAFDVNNVTFVILDQFQSPDYYTSHIPEQMGWINSALSGRPANTHAFAFTHKNMLGGNHKDNMFGAQINSSDAGDGVGVNFGLLSPANQALFIAKTNFINAFIGTLQSNKVNYMISGHDHHHYNSIVTSPDQQSKVHQLICASDSSKFYTPGAPVSTNDLPVEQQLSRIGYYIFTVDGPRVTIDYYADTTANNYSGPFNFVKQSTAGYSLNGQEFVVAEGAAYTTVADSTAKAVANGEAGYLGTTMQILAGNNNSATANNYGKAQSKAVNTAWTPAATGNFSDTVTLLGLADLGSNQTATVVVSMTCATGVTDAQIASGLFCLAAKDASGKWVNAVDKNAGGAKTFVNGPWNASYVLGTYGVDKAAGTAWAVVNYQGDFAVVQLAPQLQISAPDAKGNVNVTWPASLLPGYVLQFNSDLNTTNWVPVNGDGFFRLVKP